MPTPNSKPVVLNEAKCTEGWADEIHGFVQWRTLFSNDQTPTNSLTAGVAEIMPGNQLNKHRHAPAEIYYILSGAGIVIIEGVEYLVEANTAVFIPGNAMHEIHNTGQVTLRFFYAFAVDSFSEVAYVF